MATLTEMITEAMARKGFTQHRLAVETGITAAWVNMILRQSRPPGEGALIRIADALGIDRRRLVVQAHYERAYDEWKPFLERPDLGPGGEAGKGLELEGSPVREPEVAYAGGRGVPVIGSARAGDWIKLDAGGRSGAGTSRRKGLTKVGFHPDCKAILVTGDSLEPVAYDGQYVVVSPAVRKEDIPDGSLVYVTYELPGDEEARAMIKRVYRHRIPGEIEGEEGLPVYVFTPVNTHLHRTTSGRGGGDDDAGGLQPYNAVTLRHRQVREMYPAVGVVFESAGG